LFGTAREKITGGASDFLREQPRNCLLRRLIAVNEKSAPTREGGAHSATQANCTYVDVSLKITGSASDF
jgi:hypothetical protein